MGSKIENNFAYTGYGDKVDIISENNHCFEANDSSDPDEGAFVVPDVDSDFHLNPDSDDLCFQAPESAKGVSINVYKDCISGTCKCEHLLGGRLTQLKPCRFASLLFGAGREPSNYELKMYNGIVDGFDIVSDKSNIEGYDNRNYLSILSNINKCKMDEIVNREICNGMLEVVKQKPTCIHSLGAVDKPDGGIRPITDCSLPLGSCINENMDDLIESFSYKSVDDVVSLLSRGDYITVVDIKSAYRAVSINPEHVDMQGLRWEIDGEEEFLVDSRLCFGLRCAPFYFNLISDFVFDVLTQRYGLKVVNYLDDFAAVSSTYDECIFAQSVVISVLRYLGFYISWNKITPPSQSAVYLGVIIDTVRMELRLPECKLLKTLNLLEKIGKSKTISKKNLEKLTGLLAHCSTVVKGGRTFCRRLYDLQKMAIQKRREDVEWWSRFIRVFNGKSAIGKVLYNDEMISDSSMRGFAVHLGKDWTYGSWDNTISFDSKCEHRCISPTVLNQEDLSNINVLELWPVVVGINRWCNKFAHHKLVVVTDNLQVHAMVRTGRSTNFRCMQWLRGLFWVCVTYDIELEPRYIASADNVVPDTLSRIGYTSTVNKLEPLLENHELCCKGGLLKFFREQHGRTSEKEEEDYESLGRPVNLEESQEPVEMLQEILY